MVACLALWSADALAQTPSAPPFPDPLSPNLQTDPRRPQRFQKFTRPELAQLGPPINFVAPASGAGNTGYDSTNARKKTKLKGSAPARSPVAATDDVNPVPAGTSAAAPRAGNCAWRGHAFRRLALPDAAARYRRLCRRSGSAAGRTGTDPQTAGEAQGAYRARRPVRPARRARWRLRSISGSRTDRRLRAAIPANPPMAKAPCSIPSLRNCRRNRTGRATSSRPICAAATPATAPMKRRR